MPSFSASCHDLSAGCFQRFADHDWLRRDDPLLTANHFVGLLLWIPLNKAMFTGDHRASDADLERYAGAAVRAFLTGYGRSDLSAAAGSARVRRAAGGAIRNQEARRIQTG